MMVQPGYFEPIRKAAARRWEQLEGDPELAAPWHLLFKQVQSPRHVLSELLQNADDAGATETSVQVEDGFFVFKHNGGDFTEEHFASLCRFGYSNKRALHTIGFRGIGFKSTFSLGDKVELGTPTLSVTFDCRRFTEPQWVSAAEGCHLTQIRVRLSDRQREQEIRKNLEDWSRSPLSLLFFTHIRNMRIDGEELHWERSGSGPVPNSDWMVLNGKSDEARLIVRSDPEAFTEECLAEIRQERQLTDDQIRDFPPCSVGIVLGVKGQLFVVLPTGVETALPFACNAPFIQDPSRLKIKDPGTSPTNRWLLERIGRVSASVMLDWLVRNDLTLKERSRAYSLFPDVDRDDNSLAGNCATIVEKAFGEAIAGQTILLTESGTLAGPMEAVIIPDDLLEVWSAEQIAGFLDKKNRPPFSHHVPNRDCEKLVHWSLIERIGKPEVLSALTEKHLPKPESWPQLLKLWAYVAPDVTGYNWQFNKKALRVIPVHGKEVLYAACEVVRLGEKRLLQSDGDWEFLSGHLVVLNQNWLRYLAEQRRTAQEQGSVGDKKDVAGGLAVLAAIGLDGASDVSAVVEQVASDFFRQQTVSRADCVRLAQIAAKLDAAAGSSFRFVTQNGHLLGTDKTAIWDPDGVLEALLPRDWCPLHLLHADYVASFTACTMDEWLRWVSSGRAGLLGFVPLVHKTAAYWSRNQLEAELKSKGCMATPFYRYRTNHFDIEDWDFDDVHWRHWNEAAKSDSTVWGQIGERILAQRESFWSEAKTARAVQTATTGSTSTITSEPIQPSWVSRLQELPCLPDTRGVYRQPQTLLMRTPETEPLLDVEQFIHARLDREASRPLLTLLGVRNTPMGPSRLLDCLRALSKAEKPPIHEVEKWYRRLDQLADSCSTVDLASIREAFRDEYIVLTESFAWTNAAGAFLSSGDDEVPGAEMIRRSVQDLALWGKVGIAERPTVELALAWLKQLPSGGNLPPSDLRRVKALLARHAARIWDETGHWLNLAGEWSPIPNLTYGLSMRSLTRRSHLHEWVKQKTADFQQLSAEITEAQPFSDVPSLLSSIEERFEADPTVSGNAEPQPWLRQLGIEFQRIKLDNKAEADEIRDLGRRLADTAWRIADRLEVIPYIGGTPAGMARSAEALWRDGSLYVLDRPKARLARAVVQELERAFRRQDLTDAVKQCFDRPAAWVTDYMEENFSLSPSVEAADGILDSASVFVASQPPEAQTAFSGASPGENGNGSVIVEEAVQNESGVADKSESEPIADAPQPSASSAKLHHDRQPRPAKPPIIERFAGSNGFERDGGERFFRPSDGSWLAKPHGESLWEHRSGKGELLKYYWPKDHCLETEPLQLEADLWALLDKHPDTHSLILSDLQSHAVEITGARLKAMCNAGEVKLYPATYRLVFRNGDRR